MRACARANRMHGMGRRDAIDIQAMLAVVEAAPMTRSEIARRTGLSPAYVTMLASGERGKRASYEVVTAIKSVHDTVTAQRFTTVKT